MSEGYLLLNIYSLIILVILSIVFFRKERLHQVEDSIYARLLMFSIITIILGLLSGFIYTIKSDNIALLMSISGKVYLIGLTSIFITFFSYTFYVSKFNNNNYQIQQKVIIVCYTIISLLIMLLPLEVNFDKGNVDISGISVLFTYSIFGLIYLSLSLLLILKWKMIFGKKYIPIFMFILGGIIIFITQLFFANINYLTNPFIVIICLVMYFTIENPDVKMIELERQVAESAKAASEAKTAFLSSMSHELRTPLNAIVGLSEDIMAYKDQVPLEVREDSEDIVNASDTLLEIVGNILDINKIEGGKLELVEVDYNPKHEFESLVKIMRTKVSEKPIEFSVDIDENLPKALFGDRLRIKQVINNFLSNAIKYTDEGKIDFSVKWIAPIDSLQIIVADTGHGIKQEDMGKLFEKFERLQVEKVSSVQGTGLGLSITKNLVELMGGQIHVESEYGKGSTFSVTIPQKIGDVSKLEELDTEKQERTKADYTGKKILIVDDNSLNIKVLKKAIKPFNFDLDECYDGKTAVDKIKQNNYDIVLMDIMMPGMGGEEALSVLKKDSEFHTPVIALTADATTGAKEKYLSDGFADYLAKPFTRDIIAQKLEKILK